MTISSLPAAQPAHIFPPTHGTRPKAQADSTQTDTSLASDLAQKQSRALEAEQSVNLLV